MPALPLSVLFKCLAELVEVLLGAISGAMFPKSLPCN
jgi:hypothetical protein